MTLVELMIALAILGLVASFAIPKYEGYIEQARIARCIAEIRYIERDIQAYFVANEKYPATLGDLGLSIKNMIDPWGFAYQYLRLAAPVASNNIGEGGPFYAGGGWMLDIPPIDVAGAQGFWSGSWFVSEAWAKPPKAPTSSPPPPPPPPTGPPVLPRKDRFLVPINSDYDLYSVGRDGESVAPLTAAKSHDDIVRAANGAYVGLAENF